MNMEGCHTRIRFPVSTLFHSLTGFLPGFPSVNFPINSYQLPCHFGKKKHIHSMMVPLPCFTIIFIFAKNLKTMSQFPDNTKL